MVVLSEWVHHALADLTDPRVPGFIAVVSGLVDDDDIAATLTQQEQLTRSGLASWLATAQTDGLVRTDLPFERLARRMVLIVDGFTGQAGASTGFDLDAEQPLLFETLSSLLRDLENSHVAVLAELLRG